MSSQTFPYVSLWPFVNAPLDNSSFHKAASWRERPLDQEPDDVPVAVNSLPTLAFSTKEATEPESRCYCGLFDFPAAIGRSWGLREGKIESVVFAQERWWNDESQLYFRLLTFTGASADFLLGRLISAATIKEVWREIFLPHRDAKP